MCSSRCSLTVVWAVSNVQINPLTVSVNNIKNVLSDSQTYTWWLAPRRGRIKGTVWLFFKPVNDVDYGKEINKGRRGIYIKQLVHYDLRGTYLWRWTLWYLSINYSLHFSVFNSPKSNIFQFSKLLKIPLITFEKSSKNSYKTKKSNLMESFFDWIRSRLDSQEVRKWTKNNAFNQTTPSHCEIPR